ncbi:MAG: DUF3047 domain-containing protein [Alphaproteobacteria bacterium]|nr:DUF3047 domain-containing protein [Alphaproteobacteria bacterium]
MPRQRPRLWTGCVAGLALVLLGSAAATGGEGQGAEAIGAELRVAGWQLYADARWAPARFRRAADGSIEATTDNSTALIWKKIGEPDANRAILSWEWRVDETMAPTDITVKGGDDRPLALHVWFMEPPERQTIFQALRAQLLEAIFGLPVHGRVMTYVWGGLGARGDAQHNPHIGADSWMIVLRPGRAPTGQWLAERRDLVADYQAAFGEPPPERGIIAIAADSEDTRSRSRAFVRNIAFADGPDPTGCTGATGTSSSLSE